MRRYLTTSDVKEAISDYKETGVTDGLFKFAEIVLAECLDRTKQLDSKATSVTGYGAGILALLVSAFASRAAAITTPAWWAIVLAGLAVAGAIFFGLFAARVTDYYWFSDFD